MSTQPPNQDPSGHPRLPTNSIAAIRLGVLIFFYIVLAIIAYVLNRHITLIDPQEILGWDLRDFYNAASLASNSQNPYLTSKFVTPPLSLIPAKALLLFEFPTATLVWMGANILFLLGEYKEGGFDHELFYQWARDCQYPVYISEYSAPFEMIEMFSHRSSLSATNNKKKTVESIFWNGKGATFQTKLF